MKTIFLLFALLFSLSAQAGFSEVSCGGKCVSTGEGWLKPNCDLANSADHSAVENEIQCRQVSGFGGCAWKKYEKRTVRKGSCSNVTQDRTLDAVCGKAEMQNEKSCLAVSKCVWAPAAVTCLR